MGGVVSQAVNYREREGTPAMTLAVALLQVTGGLTSISIEFQYLLINFVH